PGCVHWRASLAALAAQNRFRRVACVCPSQAAASALADLLVEELLAARRLFTANNWPVIDVTRRSIEETAAMIMQLLHKEQG
ncbi:MAG: kinase/pyrophosphorylase, partial [Holosporales bacterium]